MKCEHCGEEHTDRLELELDMEEPSACLTLTHDNTRTTVYQLSPEVATVLTITLRRAASLEDKLLALPENVRESIPLEAVEQFILHGKSLVYGDLQVASHPPKKESELN